MRKWLQNSPYNLSVGLPLIFAEYEPDASVQKLFDDLEEYVKSALAD